MAQSGRTTIVSYNTATASAAPSAGNLTQGELAVNVTDKKLYTKDAGGAVVQVGSGPSATETLTNKTITAPLGIVKADVGLGNVDNTSDTNKPVSTAVQTALNLKANLASPTFTGTTTTAALTATTIDCKGNGSVATNVVIGSGAVAGATTGANTVALGYRALAAQTSGYSNTAIGSAALEDVTTGYSNVAVGASAMDQCAVGVHNNTAVGFVAMRYASGNYNVAVGGQALGGASFTGILNTAVGFTALNGLTTGQQNVCVGSTAANLTTGSGNTIVGNSSHSASNGNYNTIVGFNTGNGITGAANIAIGAANSVATSAPVFEIGANSNRISMGHTSITNAYVQVAWTVVSDARDKTEVKPVEPGLDFVMQLKPVSYRFRESRDSVQGHGPIRYGFLAQDVLALEGDRPVIVDAEDPNKLRFNEQALVAVLVRALQELKADFDAYKLANV